MIQLKLTEVRSGMILGDDVVQPSGSVLLKAGSTLTRSHLTLLQAHGVTSVYIRSAPQPADHQPLSEEQAEAEARSRFRHVDRDHPLVRELLRLFRRRQRPGDSGDESGER